MPGIYVEASGERLVAMQEEPYELEAVLQTLLERYPELLTGESASDTPMRYLLIKREAGIPPGTDAADRWSIDHLFVDQEGVPTLVEVKRSTDTRIRREVVGQMLEYVANALAHWPAERIRAEFEAGGEAATERLQAFLRSEEVEDFWGRVASNWESRRVRLIFVADRIPQELRTMVEFLNEELRRTDVLAVEVKRYGGGGETMKTMVTEVIGQTGKATSRKGPSGPAREWDEPSVLDYVRTREGDAAADAAVRLLAEARRLGLRLRWGTGQTHASVTAFADAESAAYRVFYLSTYVQVTLSDFDDPDLRDEFVRRLTQSAGAAPAAVRERSLTIRVADLDAEPAFGAFVEAVRWFVQRVSGHGPTTDVR